MYSFDAPGPPMARLLSVVGSAGSSIPGAFPEGLVGTLNMLLPHEGATLWIRHEGVAMRGTFSLTFDLSGHWLAPIVEGVQSYVLEPIAFYTTRNLGSLRASGLAYDPVPSNTTVNDAIRLSRVIGGVEVSGSGLATSPTSGTATITFPQELGVIRLGARVYGQRTSWLECQWDSEPE